MGNSYESQEGAGLTFYRYNGKKCKCGVATSVLAAPTGRISNERMEFVTDSGERLNSYYLGHDKTTVVVTCRGNCGSRRVAKRVYGRVVETIKCDGRCMSATGHNCECACGGQNHGANHAA